MFWLYFAIVPPTVILLALLVCLAYNAYTHQSNSESGPVFGLALSLIVALIFFPMIGFVEYTEWRDDRNLEKRYNIELIKRNYDNTIYYYRGDTFCQATIASHDPNVLINEKCGTINEIPKG